MQQVIQRISSRRPANANFLQGVGYVTGQIEKWDIGTLSQGPRATDFAEVARNAPKNKYTEQEIAALPKNLAGSTEHKFRKSKYLCLNKSDKTIWLSDYDGDMMTVFVGTHKDEAFFLYWSHEAVHSPSIDSPEHLMQRTTARASDVNLPARSFQYLTTNQS